MNISFPHNETRIRAGQPVLLLADVDGRRVDIRIEWETIVAMGGGGDDEAVRNFVKEHRPGIERVVKAHILAHDVPLSRLIVLDTAELRGA